MTSGLVRCIATVAVSAFIVGRGNGTEPGASSSSSSALVTSLCAARDDARRGHSGAANRAYYDHAHQPLHELAARVQTTDRASAARLLEAHEVVESDLATQPTSADLAAHFADLIDRTRDAVAAVNEPRPAPCPD